MAAVESTGVILKTGYLHKQGNSTVVLVVCEFLASSFYDKYIFTQVAPTEVGRRDTLC